MPARALTSTSRLLRGRWKLVTRASRPRKTWPGRINNRVSPAKGCSVPEAAAVSGRRAAATDIRRQGGLAMPLQERQGRLPLFGGVTGVALRPDDPAARLTSDFQD